MFSLQAHQEEAHMKLAHLADFTALTTLFVAGYFWMVIA
jgi:hypothetical protein